MWESRLIETAINLNPFFTNPYSFFLSVKHGLSEAYHSRWFFGQFPLFFLKKYPGKCLKLFLIVHNEGISVAIPWFSLRASAR